MWKMKAHWLSNLRNLSPSGTMLRLSPPKETDAQKEKVGRDNGGGQAPGLLIGVEPDMGGWLRVSQVLPQHKVS